MPTVSYSGDKHDRELLRLLAVKRGKKVGRLVEEAVNAAYRKELDELEAFFAPESADTHSMNTNDHKGEKQPA